MTTAKTPQPHETFGCYGRAQRMGETWIEPESDRQRRARVRFPDGKLRVVKAGGVPDTFFSIPVGGGHDGYIASQETTWAPDGEFVFRPHDKAKARYGEWPSEKT